MGASLALFALTTHAQSLPGSTASVLSGPRFLPAERAFPYAISLPEPGVIAIRWDIAPQYYLYKDKFTVSLLKEGNAVAHSVSLPDAVAHHDEFFGNVEVYFNDVSLRATLEDMTISGDISVILEFQGCAEAGFCYTLQRHEEQLRL